MPDEKASSTYRIIQEDCYHLLSWEPDLTVSRRPAQAFITLCIRQQFSSGKTFSEL
jgi:hypothetical protein